MESRFKKTVQEKLRNGDFEKISISYSNIKKISSKRLYRYRALKIIPLALITSISLGMALQHSSLATLGKAIFFPISVGVPLGIVAGSLPNNLVVINGDYQNFEKSKSKLQKLSFVEMNKN